MIGISLGWNCGPAGRGVQLGIRKHKYQGYTTCPFDVMNTNYPGLIQCLNEDFKYFTDINYLKLVTFPSTEKFHGGDTIIMNTRYGFLFNHESPGHADLYKKENWPEGKDHYINNDFKHFIERYNRRIQNFRDYIHSGNSIVFLMNRPQSDFTKLHECIRNNYPNLHYTIHSVFNKKDDLPETFYGVHKQMGLKDDDEEILTAKDAFSLGSTMEDVVFVVLHHASRDVHTNVFHRCLESIRRIYPKNRITVCKTSTTTIKDEIIQKYSIDVKNTICDGSSMWGGICHIIHEKIPRFIFMHDTVFLLKELPTSILSSDMYPLWYFTTNREEHHTSISSHLYDANVDDTTLCSIVEKYDKYADWVGYFGGCFGGTYDTLHKLYSFLQLDTHIEKYKGGPEARCSERFIPVLIKHLGIADGLQNTYSLNGNANIIIYNYESKLLYDKSLDTILSLNYDGYMFKLIFSRNEHNA